MIVMASRVKVRGIYSTALTKLILEGGHLVTEPSTAIRERFGLPEHSHPAQIVIQDRDDLQGIEVTGEAERICQIWTFLQERLLDAALLELQTLEDATGLVRAKIELPGASKFILDKLRSAVTPTLSRHHRLRIINSKMVEKAESSLLRHPQDKNTFEQQLFVQIILEPLQKTGEVKLEHIRPSGKAIRPREGTIVDYDHERVVFRRSFSEGRYDGLDLPIDKGDYGLTEMNEGQWFVKHSYFSRQGSLKGEYYNVNTPVELYPYGGRYLDLEIDVIHRPGTEPFLVDREKLSVLVKDGHISRELELKANSVADTIIQRLKA